MRITKIGHCCLLIEFNGIRILTDPGSWTTEQDELTEIDAVFITHEHSDHFHLDSLKRVLQNNPKAKVCTVAGVGKFLKQDNIVHQVAGHDAEINIKKISIKGIGSKHADIYTGISAVDNTGYLFNNEFFYPGDALTIPNHKVKILALPVAGPWIKISEAIDYGIKVKPQIAFPVHDGMLKIFGPYHQNTLKFLGEQGIDFRPLLAGETLET